MKVWSICESISVTITDIWTKFGTEHKYHTINTTEWPNSHKLKIPDCGGHHLEFRKNVNNFGLDKDILHQLIWEDAPGPCGNDHVIKSRNRKLIRVTSSNECLKHMCVDLSDYNRYLNQIWHRTPCTNTNTTRRNGQIHKNWESKMAAAAILNFREMPITLDWIQISTPKFMGRCTTAMRRWPADQKSKPEVNLRDIIKWMSGA